MPSFAGGPNYRTPIGRNQWLRSTQDIKTESYTVAASTVPAVTIDGFAGQKILQPGTVMAKITAVGTDQNKIGPFDSGATDGRQTAANIVGINNTFLPWQLMERDVEVAIAYEASAVQEWCIEYVLGVLTALTDTTAAALAAKVGVDIRFHRKVGAA
jgi:hypothetical protein